MKKFLIPIVMMLAVVTAQAQRTGDRDDIRKERAQNMDPETMASMQAKKMTLVLDLSDKQQNQVEQVLLKSAIERKEAMADKKDRSELSKEDRMAMAEARMDNQIATKRAMKDILNEEQYAKFEKMAAQRKRSKGMKEGRKDRAKK